LVFSDDHLIGNSIGKSVPTNGIGLWQAYFLSTLNKLDLKVAWGLDKKGEGRVESSLLIPLD
jgi:hypothetical protein